METIKRDRYIVALQKPDRTNELLLPCNLSGMNHRHGSYVLLLQGG